MHPHFEKEEEYALPPLGLLSSLLSEQQEDKITQEMKNNAILMTDRLKAESFSYDLRHLQMEWCQLSSAYSIS